MLLGLFLSADFAAAFTLALVLTFAGVLVGLAAAERLALIVAFARVLGRGAAALALALVVTLAGIFVGLAGTLALAGVQALAGVFVLGVGGCGGATIRSASLGCLNSLRAGHQASDCSGEDEVIDLHGEIRGVVGWYPVVGG